MLEIRFYLINSKTFCLSRREAQLLMYWYTKWNSYFKCRWRNSNKNSSLINYRIKVSWVNFFLSSLFDALLLVLGFKKCSLRLITSLNSILHYRLSVYYIPIEKLYPFIDTHRLHTWCPSLMHELTIPLHLRVTTPLFWETFVQNWVPNPSHP